MNMKRQLMMLVLALLTGVAGWAQTNFRQLTFDKALEAAKQENKLVFIDFYTDWCGPCKMMSREVFPQKNVGDFMNSHFVCLQLNAEKEGKALADTFKVRAYPTFVIVTTDGKEKARLLGYNKADLFITEVGRRLDPDKTPEKLAERYAGGERTADLISTYANYLVTESMYNESSRQRKEAKEKAAAVVDSYFDGLTDKQRVADENLFVYESFADSLAGKIASYAVKNYKRFSTKAQPVLKKQINTLCDQTLLNFFNGGDKFNAADYALCKKTISEFQPDKAKTYAQVYALLDEYGKKDYKSFLALYEKDYAALAPDYRQQVLYNLGKLLKPASADVKKQASTFIRKQLATMKPRDMYSAIYPLMLLEETK